MMYPEEIVSPMRGELTEAGFTELRTAENVIDHFSDNEGNKQSTLLVINSVCGCSAGGCRPSVRAAVAGERHRKRRIDEQLADADEGRGEEQVPRRSRAT